MFTGIIEETGILMSVKGGLSGSRLAVKADRVLEDIQKGDSIAVNGVCLTAYSFDSGCFYADVMPETLKRSNLARLPAGSPLNLERAMTAGGRFGGHIVSGHIDGTGTIVSIVRDGNALWYTVRSDPSILRRIIEKGCPGKGSGFLRIPDSPYSLLYHSGNPETRLRGQSGKRLCGEIYRKIHKNPPAIPLHRRGGQQKHGDRQPNHAGTAQTIWILSGASTGQQINESLKTGHLNCPH